MAIHNTPAPSKNTDTVNHPDHYGGKDNPYEAIKIIEAHELGFHLGNAIKYILRAGKKSKDKLQEDIKKAIWYLDRYAQKNDATRYGPDFIMAESIISKLTDDERIELFSDYCYGCGTKDKGCQCWNDR